MNLLGALEKNRPTFDYDLMRPYDEDEISTSYADWRSFDPRRHPADGRASPENIWIAVGVLGGSDYSQKHLMEANIQAMGELLDDSTADEDQWLVVYGGYGTEQLLLRGDIDDPEVVDAVLSLDDYPIVDEDLLSDVEFEAREEAFVNYGASDVLREVVRLVVPAVLEQLPDADEYDVENSVEEYIEHDEDAFARIVFEHMHLESDGSSFYIESGKAAEEYVRERPVIKAAIRRAVAELG